MGGPNAAREITKESEHKGVESSDNSLSERVQFKPKQSEQQDLAKDFTAAMGNEQLTNKVLQRAVEKFTTAEQWQAFAANANSKRTPGHDLRVSRREDGALNLEITNGSLSSNYKITLGTHLETKTGKVAGGRFELEQAKASSEQATAVADGQLLKVLPSTKPFDPAKPTVIIVDDFARPTLNLDRHGHGPSHGELSARPTDAMGQYNVIRMQVNTEQLPSTRRRLGESFEKDFSSVFTALNEKIEKGELPLGKGDVVNISFGNNAARQLDNRGEPVLVGGKPVLFEGTGEPTFAEMNQLLGGEFESKPVTAENLKEMRPKILERLKELQATDDINDQFIRGSWIRAVLSTNEAIEKIQQKGIQVMVAAGNDGPDRVSWDYLVAEKQLAAVDRNGQYLPWSAHNSLTEPSLGRFDIKYDQSKPATYKMDGTAAEFTAQELQIVGKPDRCLFRRKNDPYQTDVFQFDIAGRGKSGCMVAAVDGTSYANVFALMAEQAERRKLKQEAQAH